MYTPAARSRPQFCTPDRQRPIWQPGVRLRDGVNRHLDPFPLRFLGHHAIPLFASPGFLLPVADSILAHQVRATLAWIARARNPFNGGGPGLPLFQ